MEAGIQPFLHFLRETLREMTILPIFLCTFACFFADKSFSLSVHDPRLSPGHLKPLGTGRPKFPIEAALDFPSPEGS